MLPGISGEELLPHRVRKQVKNSCEAHKIEVSQILHKKLALTSCYYSVAFVLVHRVP